MKMKAVRCAIYTRVSTEQGLEQDFNSLDAQHDASQAWDAAKLPLEPIAPWIGERGCRPHDHAGTSSSPFLILSPAP
jgi:hypothetical protein